MQFIKDSWGKNWYVFWIADCFDPPTYLVAADNFSDAFDWFICDEKIEADLRIDEEHIGDYIEGWNREDGVPGWEEFAKAYEESRTHACTYNDNGVLVDTDNINGREATKEEIPVTIYSVGHGLRGYLPESAPFITASHSAAVESAKEDLGYNHGYGDYLVQGLNSEWLEWLNNNNNDAALVTNFMEHIRTAHNLPDNAPEYDEQQHDLMAQIAEVDELIAELEDLEEGEEWNGFAGNMHYWIETVSREDLEIPFELSGDELEQKLDEINQEAW